MEEKNAGKKLGCLVGCHLSSSGGWLAMGLTAKSIGADVFQFFTRNPRGGAARPPDAADIEAFARFAAENSIGPVLAHAPYTLNAAGAEPRVRDFALSTMRDDIKRLDATPCSLYNFHPGCHVGQGAEKGIELIAEILNKILPLSKKTFVLLETMAGKGSETGKTFEELRAIIDKVEDSSKLGVCLDTCHVWDGGYDIAGNLDGVIDKFDAIIGLQHLKAVHLNDSLNVLGSHKDRHAKIGKGKIGLEALLRVMSHPKLRGLPFYLETPNDLEGYRDEIALLKRSLAGNV